MRSPNLTLPMAMTVDVDPDYYDSSFSKTSQTEHMSWRGVSQGLPRLRQLQSDHELLRALKITWFVRVDDQIGHYYGDVAYLIDRYRDFWEDSVARGDEIALHVHLYRLNNRSWIQDNEPITIEDQLSRAFEAMAHRGFIPESSRIGDAFQSDVVMRCLDQLGLRVDSTAMPGRKRNDDDRRFNWEETTPFPYHPSRYDYSKSGEHSLDILEIPMSMLKTKTSYDTIPIKRYLDLSFHNEVLDIGLKELMDSSEILVTMLHPSGLLNDIVNEPHGLVAFKEEALVQNLESVFRYAALAGRSILPITIKEFPGTGSHQDKNV